MDEEIIRLNRLKDQFKLLSKDNVLKIIAELANASGRTLKLKEISKACNIAYTTARQLVLMMEKAGMVSVDYENPADKRAGLEVTLLDFKIQLTIPEIVRMIKGFEPPEEL